MPDVSIAFLNCHNLFPAGVIKRGSATPQELAYKVEQLGRTLAGLPLPGPPALLGLCEVQSATLAAAVAMAAYPGVDYRAVWCRSRKLPPTAVGLAILYDRRLVVGPTAVQRDVHLRRGNEVPRWLAVRFGLADPSAGDLWLVVNHWHSDRPSEADGEYGRRRLAEEIGDLFRGPKSLRSSRRTAVLDFRSDRVVLTGDLNCEPSDRVFRRDSRVGWVASPNQRAVRSAPPTRPLFFNPVWKASGVYGTYDLDAYGLNAAMVDQMLFSRELCGPTGLRLSDGSLVTAAPIGQATDHSAIAATLTY